MKIFNKIPHSSHATRIDEIKLTGRPSVFLPLAACRLDLLSFPRVSNFTASVKVYAGRSIFLQPPTTSGKS